MYFSSIIPDYASAYADTTPKMSTPEAMLFAGLGFAIGQRVIDHCYILVPEAVGFSQEFSNELHTF